VTSLAFGACAVILAYFTKDVTQNMTNSVSVRLQNEKSTGDQKVVA